MSLKIWHGILWQAARLLWRIERLLLDMGVIVVLLERRQSGATIVLRTAAALLVTKVLTSIRSEQS